MPNIQSSEHPLIGKITIHQVDGRLVDSKLSSVVILEITTRSLSFISQLTFPLSESIIYQLRTTIGKNDLELYGTIVKSMSKQGTDAHHYKFAFLISNSPFIPLLQDANIPRLYKQNGKYVTNEGL